MKRKKKIFKNLIKESLNLAWIMSTICNIQLIKEMKKIYYYLKNI